MLYTDKDAEREFDQDSSKNKCVSRSPYRRDYARIIHSNSFRRLTGKTQLFPGVESDFFRNRLTHSIEVAQIAKSIVRRLNTTESQLKDIPIDEDLVETAGLAHDLGHPPFGHNGEIALNEMMRESGGFEGNAQTLRILARLEKKITSDTDYIGIDGFGEDHRFGLNLSLRTLASVLKYDDVIPVKCDHGSKVKKGYYCSESKLVEKIKDAVVGDKSFNKFKTVECKIMDIADDIAYSTYDLEDAFKGGFLTPLSIVAANNELLGIVKNEINKSRILGEKISLYYLRSVLLEIFDKIFAEQALDLNEVIQKDHALNELDYIERFSKSYRASKEIAEVGYLRTAFTSDLVNEFIEGVNFKYNKQHPSQSDVFLEPNVLAKVEVLKRFAYVSLIISPRLAAAKIRGKEIVTEIFTRLSDSDGEGHHLLPTDFRILYEREKGTQNQNRVICDFIAGMTDRYAAEFYFRLKSENPATIFKPL